VTAIREGNVPCVENAMERALAILENNKTVDFCVNMYTDRLNNDVKLPTKDEKVILLF
jgi:hypothetical protein